MVVDAALFDIDKTLVFSSEGHREAFHEAIWQVYGIRDTLDSIDHHGKIDRQIIMEILKKNGLGEKEIESHIEECMDYMVGVFQKLSGEGKTGTAPMKGSLKTTHALHEKGVLLGVLTGNLEGIAWLKLEGVGMRKYFQFGAFGGEGRNRSEIARLAVKRAKGLGAEEVFVIGDTPRDMEAGKEAGAVTIGVASGRYSEKELSESATDYTIPNLEKPELILKIMKL